MLHNVDRQTDDDLSRAAVIDITASFTRACAALGTGQLVKDEFFTLLDSISALEIMHPKMDSGILAPGDTLEDDFDVSGELLPEEIIAIMDQLLCYEMSWHQGYPLLQTIFTSVHVDRLLQPARNNLDESLFSRPSADTANLERSSPANANPDHRHPRGNSPLLMILRAYCLGLLKSCENVIHRVKSRAYYEEEDLSTHTYSRELLTEIPGEDIIGALRHGVAWLESDDEWKQGVTSEVREGIKHALLARLALREKLLAMTSPQHPLGEQGDGWLAVRRHLETIQASHAMGSPVKGAFSPKIQRRLASTVPPRPVVELPFRDACRVLEEMCLDSLEVVRGAKLRTLSPQEVMSYIWEFNSRKPQPLCYSRACLASLAFDSPAEMHNGLLRKELEEFALSRDAVLDSSNWCFEPSRTPRITSDTRAVMASLVNDFTSRTAQSYRELLSSMCQNRCRTRRMLCHSLSAFNTLELEVQALDKTLHGLVEHAVFCPFTSWVHHMKLRQMEWVVQLGFEQSLYDLDERAGMYWWLSYISASHVDLLERVHGFVGQRHARFLEDGRAEDSADVLETRQHVESMLHATTGTLLLASALGKLYTLLHYLDAVPTPHRPFGKPAWRYELRMKPFIKLDTPRLPSFEEFDRGLHPFGPYGARARPLREIVYLFTHDVEHLVKDARSEFAAVERLGAKAAKSEGVKEAWEKIPLTFRFAKNIQNILLSCIATGTAGATLAKLEKVDSLGELVAARGVKMKEVEQPKRYHDWWLVPKVEVVELPDHHHVQTKQCMEK